MPFSAFHPNLTHRIICIPLIKTCITISNEFPVSNVLQDISIQT